MDSRSVEHALSAIAHVRGRLSDASAAVASVRKKLNEGWGTGVVYWEKIGEKLARERSSASHYRELVAALKEIDSAVEKAKSACDRLTSAAHSWRD